MRCPNCRNRNFHIRNIEVISMEFDRRDIPMRFHTINVEENPSGEYECRACHRVYTIDQLMPEKNIQKKKKIDYLNCSCGKFLDLSKVDTLIGTIHKSHKTRSITMEELRLINLKRVVPEII